MKKSFIVLPIQILLFLFITSCNGQGNKTAAQKVTTEKASCSKQTFPFDITQQFKKENSRNPFTYDDGRQVGRYVTELYQDSRGLIWMGTSEKGVALYIGQKLIYFTEKDGLAGNQINGITEDPKGNIWIATNHGVSMYPGGEFTNYTTKNGLKDENVISILADSKGTIWVGTRNGVSTFNGSKFIDFDLPKPTIKEPTFMESLETVWQIIEDQKGNIWFARDGYGATKYNRKTFQHFTQKEGLCGNDVYSILEDKEGNIWFGSIATRVPSKENKFHYIDSKNGGLSKYNGSEIIQFPGTKGLKNNDVYLLYADTEGDVWVGSKNVGLYTYDGENFTFFGENGELRTTVPQAVLEDTDGQMWFGFSGGLYTESGNRMENVTKFDLGYDPYAIKFKVNKTEIENTYELVVSMELDSGAYFASPLASDSYKGFFRVSVADNDKIIFDSLGEENPKSIKTLDFSNDLVNIVRENTTYAHKFTVNKSGNFEVNGLVGFVIEPKCTLEEIPFVIIYKSGKISVRKVQGGC